MMTRRLKLGGLVGTMTAGFFGTACGAGENNSSALAGRWGGFLAAGGSGLRLVLELSVDQPIVMYSPDQGSTRIPATKGNFTSTHVTLEFGSVRAKLKLKLNPAGVLVGTFQQGVTHAIEFKLLAIGEEPVRPTPAPFGDLQQEVNEARSKFALPALAAAFVARKNGQVSNLEAVSGVLVQGQSTPVSTGQRWHIGSITKSMTATLVARLVERGLIDWNGKLSTLFGQLAPDMLPVYRDKTLAELLTGKSGMPTNIAMTDFIGHVTSSATPTQRRRVWAQQAFKMPPMLGAAASFVYPNNGYVLAGALCEATTGKSYEQMMSEEVFGPLGMTSAGFGPPAIGNPEGHRRAMLGGRLIGVGVESGADNPAAMGPAGRAHMTLLDLAKFGLAHSEGHQGLNNAFLKQETWRYLHAPPMPSQTGEGYAFGWIVRPDQTLWHNGSNTYWLAELAFDPNKSVSAAACANVANSDEAVGRVLAAGMAQASA
jgi:CubicO group peptidase (beta-lactamase class C family)